MATNNVLNLKGTMPTFAAYNANPQTVESGTSPEVLEFPTSLFNVTSSYNTGTSVFTAPIAGYYLFGVNSLWVSVVGSTSDIYINLVTTGGTIRLTQGNNIGVSTYPVNFSGTALCAMAVGDTCYATMSTAIAAGIITTPADKNPMFWGYLVALV